MRSESLNDGLKKKLVDCDIIEELLMAIVQQIEERKEVMALLN